MADRLRGVMKLNEYLRLLKEAKDLKCVKFHRNIRKKCSLK